MIDEFKTEINKHLKSGTVIEKDTRKLVNRACSHCFFAHKCDRDTHIHCMAHNRVDRRSVYYIKKTRL